ncbi:hypothetical protein B0H19DRAFT_1189676 [Mycena capillaripes]|nr:hypothetical protein B0H19DRAFT_1189676 [Mycena capillaripes]
MGPQLEWSYGSNWRPSRRLMRGPRQSKRREFLNATGYRKVDERNGEVFFQCDEQTRKLRLRRQRPCLIEGFGLSLFNLYVALSRSSSRETIRLLRDFDHDMFQKPHKAKFSSGDDEQEDQEQG